MKKTVYLSIIISLMAYSCGKVSPSTSSDSSAYGGSWALEGNTYTASLSTVANNSLTVTSTLPPYSSITLFFPGSALPTVFTDTFTSDTVLNFNPTYRVVNTKPTGDQVNIRVTTTTEGVNTIYDGLGENDSIKVSFKLTSVVSTSGRISSIDGSGIKLLNISNPSDSALLMLSITQTQ